jgi:ankyrin repeat protein
VASIAAYFGREGIAGRLLEAGANINALSSDGKTALIVACDEMKHRNNALIRLLISRGADVNVQDESGGSALYNAARVGNARVIRMLVAVEATVYRESFEAAAQRGYLAALKEFFQVGINPELALPFASDDPLMSQLIRTQQSVRRNMTLHFSAKFIAARERPRSA